MIALSARTLARVDVLIVTVLGVLAASPSVGVAGQTHRGQLPVLSLSKALRTAGGPTIPAAWAGIWATEDSVHLCSDPAVLFTDAGLDTLCAGEPIDAEEGGVELSCTGTIDDTSANITCTGSQEVSRGCTVTYETTIVATRNGDSYFAETTITATYEPELCDSKPNSCIVNETTANRVGPAPPDCLSPVQEGTWGRVKAVYR